MNDIKIEVLSTVFDALNKRRVLSQYYTHEILSIGANLLALSEDFDSELIKFVTWIVTPKHFNSKYIVVKTTETTGIKCFSDLQSNYTHSRLQRCFKEPVFYHLFNVFINKGETLIFEGLPKDEIVMYREAVNDFILNFSLNFKNKPIPLTH